MTVCKVLDGIAQTYHCRPSDLVAGGHASLSFDVAVRMKASAK